MVAAAATTFKQLSPIFLFDGSRGEKYFSCVRIPSENRFCVLNLLFFVFFSRLKNTKSGGQLTMHNSYVGGNPPQCQIVARNGGTETIIFSSSDWLFNLGAYIKNIFHEILNKANIKIYFYRKN